MCWQFLSIILVIVQKVNEFNSNKQTNQPKNKWLPMNVSVVKTYKRERIKSIINKNILSISFFVIVTVIGWCFHIFWCTYKNASFRCEYLCCCFFLQILFTNAFKSPFHSLVYSLFLLSLSLALFLLNQETILFQA